MRFTGWLCLVGVASISVVWGQQTGQPRGNLFRPRKANIATTAPIVFLGEFADAYQALKAGRTPANSGAPRMLAANMLEDPRRCTAPMGGAAMADLSISLERFEGHRDPTTASNREIVLTSIARYACADADHDERTPKAVRVPGYGMMALTKGTFAETIAPRKQTVLPGLSSHQAAAFQSLGDANKALRVERGTSADPGSIAARMAEFQEAAQLSPEERSKAFAELKARHANDQTPAGAVERAQVIQNATQIVGALSAQGDAAPDSLAFLKLLQRGEVYVDLYKFYARKDDGFGSLHYLAVISDSQGSHLVRLGPAEPIDAAVDGYMANPEDHKTFEASWRTLQHLVAQPLLAALPAETRMIWVSPDSNLFSLPFASLMLELKAELTVTLVPSAYDFSRLASISAGTPTGKALLVGDLTDSSAADSGVRAVALSDITSGLAYQKLHVQTLSGRDATLTTVTAGMKDAQYILFSTHGRWANGVSTTSSEAFRSAGIALWGEGGNTSDSVLTAADVLRMNLSQSDLVVLLACETAQGLAVNGQGSLGFQSAFMSAGTRSLLVALWRVPVYASKQIMRDFYYGLFEHHLSRADALKQAQEALRRQPGYSDPWNWGGWVLVGDSRPVSE
jgi:hypothetical protein